MRMIHGVLFTAGVLSGAMAVRAQAEQPALQGLPAYGITLTGTPESPVLENHSGRVVIGYDMKFSDANGRWAVLNLVMADSELPAGIPDGGAIYAWGMAPVNSTAPMASPPQLIFAGQGPTVTVVLHSLIFSDGQFVGANEHRCFEQFAMKLKAISEVGTLAKTQAWDQVEGLYQAFTQRRQAPPPGLAAPPPSVEDTGSTSGQSNAHILSKIPDRVGGYRRMLRGGKVKDGCIRATA